MVYDALTTAAVAHECQVLVGGRVQQVVQIDEWGIGFAIYVSASTHADPGQAQGGRRVYLLATAAIV